MIFLPTKNLRKGMITAQSIYNSKGASYLIKGTPLTDQYIDRLQHIGVPQLSVTSLNPSFSLLPPEDVVQEKTRIAAIKRVLQIFEEIHHNDHFNIESIHDISESIILDLVAQRNNLVQLTDLRLHDNYTFAHSVNVAVLSTMLGFLCHYSKSNLMKITLGSLLHDIGKSIIPPELLSKPSTLTKDEYLIIQMHPEAGRKKLHELEMPVSSLITAIVAQHHEHYDGTGYPHHLAGENIHRFARIVSIADVYDALTSNRPYKKAYKPHVAYKIMTTCSDGQFDEELLNLFFDNVAIYPVGTILKTALGYGIVKRVEFGHTRTPIVAIFATHQAQVLPRPLNVNLAQCPTDVIEHVLEDHELFSFIHQINIDPAIYLADV